MAPRKQKAKKARESSMASVSSVGTNRDDSIMVSEDLNTDQQDFKREMMIHITKLDKCLSACSKGIRDFSSSVPKLIDRYLEEMDLNSTVDQVFDGITDKVVGNFLELIANFKLECDKLQIEVQLDVREYCRGEGVSKNVAGLLTDFANKVPAKLSQVHSTLQHVGDEMKNQIVFKKRETAQTVLKMKVGDLLASQEDVDTKADTKKMPPPKSTAPPVAKKARVAPTIEVEDTAPSTSERARPTRRIAASQRTPSLDSTYRAAPSTGRAQRSNSANARATETPGIIPKFDVNTPYSCIPKRLPKPGEMAVSLSGSPLMSAADFIQMTTGARGTKSRRVRDQLDIEDYYRQMQELLGNASILAEGGNSTFTAPKAKATGRKK